MSALDQRNVSLVGKVEKFGARLHCRWVAIAMCSTMLVAMLANSQSVAGADGSPRAGSVKHSAPRQEEDGAIDDTFEDEIEEEREGEEPETEGELEEDIGKGAVSARRVEDGAGDPDEDPDKDAVRMRALGNQVVILNRLTSTVYYQFRVGSGAWSNYSLAPNWFRTHTISGGTPSARFDWSFSPGIQNRQYSLLLGSDNEFQRLSNGTGLDLIRVGTTPVGPPPVTSCSNTCRYAFDGECDDGGPGSDYRVCSLGTDCGDCGSRGGGPPPPRPRLCTNTCRYAFDGECDDGGAGSDYSVCSLGTDCGDCGSR